MTAEHDLLVAAKYAELETRALASIDSSRETTLNNGVPECTFDDDERERGREDDERNCTHRSRDASEDENDERRRCDVGFDAHLDSGTHGQRKRGADDDADDAERDVGRG